MERRKKEPLAARDPKRAWETIKEMILDDEDMTVEELDAELREYGIDPDESTRRLFELALRIARKPNASGRVSPHVSEILSQLAAKCCRPEAKTKTAAAQGGSLGQHQKSAGQESKELGIPARPKARAAVLSYHRNYKEETPNDRAIRLKNERQLQEMAAKLRERKFEAKK